MRIYYSAFSTITRYLFKGNLEAIGEISLTPEPILINSCICYYEDLEYGVSFNGNFKNPKVYKEYRWEICDKYKDTDEVKISKALFNECGVEFHQLKIDKKIEINIKND